LGKIPEIKKLQFPNGKRGNYETVSFIKKVAREYSGHPVIRKLAINILNSYNTDSHNHLDEAYAIGDFVKKNIKYVKDPHSIEYIQCPEMMVRHIEQGIARGDCDDMVTLAATLLLAIGIVPHLVICKYRDHFTSFQHIYLCVYENNYRGPRSRLVLDCIVKDQEIGYEVPHAEKKEFKV
jgi:hypothetical protein